MFFFPLPVWFNSLTSDFLLHLSPHSVDPVKVKHLFIACISFNGHVQLVSPVTLYSLAWPSHSLINSQWPLWQCGQDHWWICSIGVFVCNIQLSGGGTPAVWMVTLPVRKCVCPAHCLCACSHGTCVMCEFWGMAIERWTHRLSQGHHLTWLHVCLCKTVCVWAQLAGSERKEV